MGGYVEGEVSYLRCLKVVAEELQIWTYTSSWNGLQVLLKIGFILGGSEEEVWVSVILGKPGGFCLKISYNCLIEFFEAGKCHLTD